MDDRREIARSRGYPDAIFDKMLLFETAVREKRLGEVVYDLYEKGAVVYNIGFRFPPKLRFTDFVQCVVSGDLAATWELWEAPLEKDGETTLFEGRSSEVWRCTNGDWKQVFDHASMALSREQGLAHSGDRAVEKL